MNLKPCVQQFFDQYLVRIKGSSLKTVAAYRQVFGLLLPFAAKHQGIGINRLTIDHLTPELIMDFLDQIQIQRQNTVRTRNHRLAAIKSFARMIRLLHPENQAIAEKILRIPQKRMQRALVGFLYPDEIMAVYDAVDLKKPDGMRDYTLLHLLYDSGARASEIATLKLDYFDPLQQSLAILGKGNRFRMVSLWPKTVSLMERYIDKYRLRAKLLHRQSLFINQRKEALTRHGIHHICKKYLSKALCPKRLKDINPVHSFRHSCAVRMLLAGESLAAIKNHLGHINVESTMVYLNLDLRRKRDVQRRFIEYTQSIITDDPKIDNLIDWENKNEILAWLDSL
ncbi:MAG: tyrosine-type recombinase/integrase [Desulfosalsimonas sp.]